jgi:hypothetical protein
MHYNQWLGPLHTFIDFKKIPDEEKLNAFKGLLKGTLHTRLISQPLSLPDYFDC